MKTVIPPTKENLTSEQSASDSRGSEKSISNTPMLKQYHSIKKNHQDCILFFRLGDFYEMFYEDAKIVSKALDLVLTSRGKGTGSKVPMCGFPHHSSANYIKRLVKLGHKVAICEQTEDPSQAKGIVKRDVTRIITSGTYLDEDTADARFLACLFPDGKNIGIAFCDPSSGTIHTNQYAFDQNRCVELLASIPLYECIYPISSEDEIKKLFDHPTLKNLSIVLSPFDDWCFNPDIAKKALCEHFAVTSLHGFGLEDLSSSISGTGALLEYLKQMNKQPLEHIDRISLYSDDDFVFISPAAHRGLELSTLITTLDKTQTALGKRKFKDWLYKPLKNSDKIIERQDAVKLLKDNDEIEQELRNQLKGIPDIEKNISRLSCGYVHARDLLALRNTLIKIPLLRKIIAPLSEHNELFTLKDIENLRKYLETTINEEIPLSKPEGKIVSEGIDQELDDLRNIQSNGRQWLKEYQETEIQKSKINSLKIGFNKVFGYYIEVTKTNLNLVPETYIRKQTLVNAERYITPELKEYEEKILTAQDKVLKIEQRIIEEAKQKILNCSFALHQFCEQLATLDVLSSFSGLAKAKGYICPEINDTTALDIKEGRHPVVELSIEESFIANDTLLDCEQNHLVILTGPNMSGKSTYIRQTAILVIMAQAGSFIPAQTATIGLVDKIFTRIGAHDDISKGQSTFMVEMNEAADILNNLSKRSLVILDEIGRGTSTYDGLSLAWALAEHIHQTKVRTLFATHFHELTALADKHNGIKNYNVAVKEWKDNIIFLHKIIEGGTDDSYGIYVAKLAGIPHAVINRAKQILTKLELKNDLKQQLQGDTALNEKQIDLFSASVDQAAEQLKAALIEVDINNLTPLDALNKLKEMKDLINE